MKKPKRGHLVLFGAIALAIVAYLVMRRGSAAAPAAAGAAAAPSDFNFATLPQSWGSINPADPSSNASSSSSSPSPISLPLPIGGTISGGGGGPWLPGTMIPPATGPVTPTVLPFGHGYE